MRHFNKIFLIIGSLLMLVSCDQDGRGIDAKSDQFYDEGCYESFCLIVDETESEIIVSIEVSEYTAKTLIIDFEVSGLTSQERYPITQTFTEPDTIELITFTKGEGSWEIQPQLSFSVGIVGAEHDNTATYQLPYQIGTSHYVSQGYGGEFSHENENALDFAMDEGTPIYSARAGRVIDLEEGYVNGGESEEYADKANFIYILHEDLTIAVYAHLQANGVHVEQGDEVERGVFIGYSGNTGFSSGPHLHFTVFSLLDISTQKTIETYFKTSNNLNGEILTESEEYTAAEIID